MDAADVERVLIDSLDLEVDSELTKSPAWVQVRTPSSRHSNHNQILRARINDADVDATIDAVAEEHQSRGACCRWFVGPSSIPQDLAHRLAARGWRRLGEGLGMTLAVPSEDSVLGVPGLIVRPMNADDVDIYASVTASGFERGADFREAARHIAAKSLRATAGPEMLSFIGMIDGEPVATSQLRLLRGVGYFQGAAVLPAHRRRGIYAALVHHRLAIMRDRGLATAVVWAEPTSSGLACQKLGFRTICRGTFMESATAS